MVPASRNPAALERFALLPLLLAALAVPALAAGPVVVPAALRSASPAGMRRGTTILFTLGGVNIRDATAVMFDDPGITGSIRRLADPNRNQVQVAVTAGAGVRPGIHSLSLRTPMGVTGGVSFAVGAWAEVGEKEPDDDPASAPVASLPATLTGTIDRPGDVDCFRFPARAGQELVFQALAAPLRSRLNPVMEMLDDAGKVLAESGRGLPDGVLGIRIPRDGTYCLRVRDFENGGAGDYIYRINAGEFAFVTGTFPLGMQQANSGEVQLLGFGLSGRTRLAVHAPEKASRGETMALPLADFGERLLNSPRIAVGGDPEVTEQDDGANDTPSGAQSVPVPVTINGRILHARNDEPDVDHYRFHARKGQPLVLEVSARRLGSPLDSVIEVLDTEGRPVERATLRCVAQTVTTLSDRDSASQGLRLLAWSDLRVNDLVYIDGEVARIASLPRGPDDDCIFAGFRGQRLGFLDTTPRGHAMESPVYKVRVYPPHASFPPSGMPVFHLKTENDDGGPLSGKDSYLTFDPPVDGEYVVRIRDVRGEQGERYAYRLSIHPPRPGFHLSLSTDRPTVPRGAAVPVDVMAERFDGFDGAIEIQPENIPSGLTLQPATIAPGETSATVTLGASPNATVGEEELAKMRLVGTGALSTIHPPGGGLEKIRFTQPLGLPLTTLLPPPDVTVTVTQARLELRPGSRVTGTVRIDRHNGFDGRVPIEIRNLPYGVRVLDVGLNGILIVEGETSRQFTLEAEPWVKPQERSIYAVATVESDPASLIAAPPLKLEVK